MNKWQTIKIIVFVVSIMAVIIVSMQEVSYEPTIEELCTCKKNDMGKYYACTPLSNQWFV